MARVADEVCDALAVARLTRLVAVDVITEPLRDRWVLWRYDRANTHPGVHMIANVPPRDWPELHSKAPRSAKLIGCRWCVGVWIAAACAFARWRWPRSWRVTARALSWSYVAGVAQAIER